MSVDVILASVAQATRIVFVCNPGNPTGTRIANTELTRLRISLPSNVLIVIDQAYVEFDDQGHQGIFALLDHGNTVITRTFSKAYALAGQRVGWGAFPTEIAAEVRKLLSPNNVSLVAQAMATAAMKDQAYMHHIVSQTATSRDWFIEKLTAAGYAIPQSHTNFVLVPFASGAEAKRVDRQLRSAGYLVRGMGGYGLDHCLRVTLDGMETMRHVAGVIVGS
ncbi:aminotransferase class I/II-fold pyridoxal phosphate-dependent enzyme [Granulosicoccus sp.]|nr:histidinol-phosphate transaminase [Granulosicoccus sp.]MDB4223249.1 aminotransferase class I/II-fold pyridoxal phosphate-dependent enzyme [Granulosicoccus sp.]